MIRSDRYLECCSALDPTVLFVTAVSVTRIKEKTKEMCEYHQLAVDLGSITHSFSNGIME